MIILAKADISDCNVTPNLGTILIFHFEREAHQTCGDITCGHIATVLTTALALYVSILSPLDDERRVFYTTLQAVSMIYKKQGSFFIHIPGARRLFPAPLFDNLFSLENGQFHYVVQ
jgi:hypothetical protein